MSRHIYVLCLIGLIWGITNYFIGYFNKKNKDTGTPTDANDPFYIRIRNKIIKNKVSLGLFVINQSGSLLNLLSLGKMNLSLTTIVTNSVSFISAKMMELFHMNNKITLKFIIGLTFMGIGLGLIASNSQPINENIGINNQTISQS